MSQVGIPRLRERGGGGYICKVTKLADDKMKGTSFVVKIPKHVASPSVLDILVDARGALVATSQLRSRST